jgi:uncharacterized protein (DUF2141 family)
MWFRLFICLFLVLFATQLVAQSVEVEVNGIRKEKGVVRLAVFTNEECFRRDAPAMSIVLEKKMVSNGRLTHVITGLKSGEYGIALLDDENSNGKLDYRLLLPAEGIGFSNYTHRGIKRPRFNDFCFVLNSAHVKVNIQVTYY